MGYHLIGQPIEHVAHAESVDKHHAEYNDVVEKKLTTRNHVGVRGCKIVIGKIHL